MTNNTCGCGHDHDDEVKEEDYECCGGGCCGEDHAVIAEDDCDCGHGHSAAGHAISHDDMEKLKQAIIDAGYQIEETADGDIKILEK